jgi:hypothetical protein
MHPLLRLIATQPQLLAAHAEAYADMVAEEIETVSTAWKRQAMLNAVALCSIAVSAVLAGVALMLWAVIPAEHVQSGWALIVAPLLPALVAAWCLASARAGNEHSAFDNLRRQVKADMVMLSEASAR